MKKLLSILLTVVFLLTAAACSNSTTYPQELPPPIEEAEQEEALAPGQDPAPDAPKLWQAGVVYGLADGCPYPFPLNRTKATQAELDRWNELMGSDNIDRFDARSMSEYGGVVTPENARTIFEILQKADLALMEEMGNPNTGGSLEIIALDREGSKLFHCLYDQYWFTVQFGEEDSAYVFDGSLVGWSQLEEQLGTLSDIDELDWEEYVLHMAGTKGLNESELRSLENMGYLRDEIQSIPMEEIRMVLGQWEDLADQQEETAALFGIGPEGELKEIADGGKIDQWLVAELYVQDDNWVEATFLSNIEVECTVTLDPMAQERAYIFAVKGEDCDKFPFYKEDDREGVWFQPYTNGEVTLDCLKDLTADGQTECRVTIYEYNYSYVPMAGYSMAGISQIELLS